MNILFNQSVMSINVPLVRLLLVVALTASTSALSADGSNYKTVDGLTVYLGMLPAAMIRGQHEGHPEEVMHNGVPRGRHSYHLVVAVFDAASGERIEDVSVEATLTPLGLAGTTRPLEPMSIADTVTYGNYFTLPSDNIYRIVLSIRHANADEPTRLEFTYQHPLR